MLPCWNGIWMGRARLNTRWGHFAESTQPFVKVIFKAISRPRQPFVELVKFAPGRNKKEQKMANFAKKKTSKNDEGISYPEPRKWLICRWRQKWVRLMSKWEEWMEGGGKHKKHEFFSLQNTQHTQGWHLFICPWSDHWTMWAKSGQGKSSIYHTTR